MTLLPTATLAGCREKQRRADEHFAALDGAIADWIGEPKPGERLWEMRGEFRPDEKAFVFSGQLRRENNELLRWGVILGDAVHNTRSALDQLVWQLVLLNGGTPSSRNQFPICDSEADYLGAAGKGRSGQRDRQLEGMSDDHKQRIDDLQPYCDPRSATMVHSLSALRDLSNQDKHRVIHMTNFAVDFPSTEAMDKLLVANEDAGERYGTWFAPLEYERETEVFKAYYTCPGARPDVRATGLPPLGIGIGSVRLRLEHVTGLAAELAAILDSFESDF